MEWSLLGGLHFYSPSQKMASVVIVHVYASFHYVIGILVGSEPENKVWIWSKPVTSVSNSRFFLFIILLYVDINHANEYVDMAKD